MKLRIKPFKIRVLGYEMGTEYRYFPPIGWEKITFKPWGYYGKVAKNYR